MLRRIFTFIPVLLLLGSALLLFFINLIGTSNGSFLGEFYWSEVDSRTLGTDHDKSRWTLYSLCGVKDGKNSGCTSRSPAYPYSPLDNFDSLDNIPQGFIDDRSTYYYLSRFAYAFFLIGIVFTVLAIFPTILTCCLSGFITGILGSLACGVALLFTAAGAALNTAAHVKGRNLFRDAGISAKLDSKTFGILWAAVACLLISFIWNCVVGAKGAASRHHRHDDSHESYAEPKISSTDSSREGHLMYNDEDNYAEYQQQPVAPEPQTKKFFFSRRQQPVV